MEIHHSKMKKAMEIGCYVSVAGPQRFRIFWPKRAVELFGGSVGEVLEEMMAVQSILGEYPDYRFVTNGKDCYVILCDTMTGRQMVGTPALPTKIQSVLEANEAEWHAPMNGREEPKPPDDPTHINGVHVNGGIAHKEGVPASDCPFLENSPEFYRWNDEWDAAADKELAEETAPKVGSVVTNRYRAHYSESGHPTHCGDELAVLLNNICLNKAGINLELFEAICAANDVNLTKYNRTTKGWQGRLRMTGRNLLAKRVRENGGRVKMPTGLGPEHYDLSKDWLAQADNKFKPKNA